MQSSGVRSLIIPSRVACIAWTVRFSSSSVAGGTPPEPAWLTALGVSSSSFLRPSSKGAVVSTSGHSNLSVVSAPAPPRTVPVVKLICWSKRESSGMAGPFMPEPRDAWAALSRLLGAEPSQTSVLGGLFMLRW